MFKKYFLYLLFLSISFHACTDGSSLEELGPVVRLGAAPMITGPSNNSSFIFAEAEEAKLLPAITWTAADFGYPAAVTYDIQLDLKGNNFSNPLSLGITNQLSSDQLTVGFLNNLLFAQGLPEAEAIDVEIRLVATVSDEVDPLISSPIPLTLTLYEVIIIYPKLHLPGDYQEWDPSTEVNVIFSLLSNKKYEGFNYFGLDDAVFKFTDGPSWDVNWGDEEPDGNLDAQGIGNDIPIGGAAGTYFLKCNLNSLTYSIEPASMGVLGTATAGGWDEDMDMEYDPATNLLTLTTDLSTGVIKFRANDDWALNLGDNDGNGKLQLEGADIEVTEAGNYTINLEILNVAEYRYELIKN